MNKGYSNISFKIITNIIIISVFAGINFISACNRDLNCPERQNRVFLLDGSDKSRIASTGTDTVAFVNDLNDTTVLIGQGKKVMFRTENGLGNPDCGYGQDSFEINIFNYKRIKGLMNLTISLTKNQYNGDLVVTADNYNYYLNYNYYMKTFDSLVVNNKTYYNVSLYRESHLYAAPLFYSASYGVIKVSNIGYTWSRL